MVDLSLFILLGVLALTVILLMILVMYILILFRGRDRQKETSKKRKGKPVPNLSIIKNKRTNFNNLGYNIKETQIKNILRNIIIKIDKIIEKVQGNPRLLKSSKNYLNYYLDSLILIVKKVINLEDNKEFIENYDKVVINIKDTLHNLDKQYDNYISSLFKEEVQDLDIELKVLDSEIKNRATLYL